MNFGIGILGPDDVTNLASIANRPGMMASIAHLWGHGKLSAAVGMASTIACVAPHDAWLSTINCLTFGEADLTPRQTERVTNHPAWRDVDGDCLFVARECVSRRGGPVDAPISGILATYIYHDVANWAANLIRMFCLATHISALSIAMDQPIMSSIKALDAHDHGDNSEPCMHCRIRQAFSETFDLPILVGADWENFPRA